MKILFLQDDFPPYAKGGAGMVVAALARALARRGHTVTVITAVQDPMLAGSFREDGLRIERIYSDYAQRWRSWRSLYNPATVPAVRRILAEVRPDIVHAHNLHYHLSYWALRLAKRCGARVFLTAHDVMLFHYGKLTNFAKGDYHVSPWQQVRVYRFWYNPFRNQIIKRLLTNVDRIFAVSAALKDALEQNNIENVEVLHNGIDSSAWEVSRETVEAFIEKYQLAGKKAILFGGRISGQKGGDAMLTALREIARVEPTAVLLLLGTRDAYVERLIVRAREWGIGEHIVSTGWLAGDELHAAYHAAQLVVVPSLCFDSFPTVVLEAMACGTPVVGSCQGGIPEMVQDGETGLITNPLDTARLARDILELLSDARRAAAYVAAAHTRVAQEFTVDRWCDRLVAAYTGTQ